MKSSKFIIGKGVWTAAINAWTDSFGIRKIQADTEQHVYN